jgi:hypothetical protein
LQGAINNNKISSLFLARVKNIKNPLALPPFHSTKRCLIGPKLWETIEGQKSTGVLSPHVFTKKILPWAANKISCSPKNAERELLSRAAINLLSVL